MMRIVDSSNDPVRLSFLLCLLRDCGIEPVLLDQHVSQAEGGIGAIPRRIAVSDAQEAQARRLIADAEPG